MQPRGFWSRDAHVPQLVRQVVMHVVVPPVFVGGRIVRVVSSTPHLYEVEEWMGEWWQPSAVTLSVATSAPSAPDEVLDARGVPPEDRRSEGERLSAEALSESLRAPAHDYTRDLPSLLAGHEEPRARKREYPGSAKFRRPRAPQKRTAEKRRSPDAPSATWTGPFRRATDQHGDTPPSTPPNTP